MAERNTIYLIHRIIALVLGLVFILFAVFQINDPDPMMWVPVYMIPATICIFTFFRKPTRIVPLVAMVAYIVGAILFWPAAWEGVALEQGMKTMNIEHARESLGMMICAFSMIYMSLIGFFYR